MRTAAQTHGRCTTLQLRLQLQLLLLAWLCLATNKSVRATLGPAQPFAQLQSSNTQYFEQAYHMAYGPEGVGNLNQTLEEFDSMMDWLQSAGMSEGPSHNGPELLAAARELSDTQLNISNMSTLMMRISSHLMHASVKHGHPLARRLIIGALVKQRAARGPFTGPARLLADMLLLQFYLLHKRAVTSRPAIQYLHVSKSGGTNMCGTAASNGCSSQGFDDTTNCKIGAFTDWPRWVTNAGHQALLPSLINRKSDKARWFVNFNFPHPQVMNCTQRADYLRRHGWNFYANEYASPGGRHCHEMTSLMLWRHPIKRMESHMHYVQVIYARNYNKSDLTESFGHRKSDFWQYLLPVGVNNQYIRALLGPQAWVTPLKHITREQTQAAKLKVLQQDVLLVLERKAYNDLAFRQGLGWAQPMSNAKVRAVKGQAKAMYPVDFHELVALNAPDVEVYNWVLQLQTLDSIVWYTAEAMREDLQLDDVSGNTAQQCGYVSTGLLERSGQQKLKSPGV